VTGPAQSDRRWKRLGVAAAVACGLCCAAPLIALLGGFGTVSALAAVFQVFELVSIVLAVLAFGAAGILWARRRRRQACQVPDRAAEQDMPTPSDRRSI
jgi:hypothetical protein